MKKIGVIVAVLILLVAGFVAAASMQPDDFRVERSAVIQASASTIFDEVNDLRRWEAWSPWAKLDPNAKNEFSGAQTGETAALAWDGDKNIGKGKMTIVESTPSSHIKMQLDFIKPMESTSYSEFKFEPEGDATRVTWSMYGPNNLIGKMIGLVFNCEKMIGDMYDEGLTSLAGVVEAQ